MPVMGFIFFFGKGTSWVSATLPYIPYKYEQSVYFEVSVFNLNDFCWISEVLLCFWLEFYFPFVHSHIHNVV